MKFRSWMMLGGMAAGLFGGAMADTPVVSHADSFSKEGLLQADVSKLADTQLVAHPGEPLDPAKNVLWCGTLQLAWNEAIGLVGEKLRFVHQPPVVDLLDQEDFTRADLDASSYVAIADFEHNHVEDEIRAALEKTFHGAASPELIPPNPVPTPGPDDPALVAYAYLYKNLAFAQPFEDKKPLGFGSAQVKNFGFTAQWNKLRDPMTGQVSICAYDSADNFIIKLKTKDADDELILAKIVPAQTLQKTVEDVVQRAEQGPGERPGRDDYLSVPKLNFDLRSEFPSLQGLVLQPGPGARVKNLVIKSVQQLVRFQLNENGAILKSEAEMAMVATAIQAHPKIHALVFDRPFLIVMKRANSPRAYFALWVGNASLLVPAGKP